MDRESQNGAYDGRVMREEQIETAETACCVCNTFTTTRNQTFFINVHSKKILNTFETETVLYYLIFL